MSVPEKDYGLRSHKPFKYRGTDICFQRNERRKKIEARGEGAHRQSTDSTKVHDVEKGDGPQTDDWTDDTPSTRHIPATATVAAAADDDDPNVVWWDGDDDPEHPFNWPSWKTFSNIALISGLTFISPLASCETTTRLLYLGTC